MKITVKRGDITDEAVDAIVNPSNSYGVMGGGASWAIKRSKLRYNGEGTATSKISVFAGIKKPEILFLTKR